MNVQSPMVFKQAFSPLYLDVRHGCAVTHGFHIVISLDSCHASVVYSTATYHCVHVPLCPSTMVTFNGAKAHNMVPQVDYDDPMCVMGTKIGLW